MSAVLPAGQSAWRDGVQSPVHMFSPSDWQPEHRIWTTASVAASTRSTSNSKSKTNAPYWACWSHWPSKSSLVATEDASAHVAGAAHSLSTAHAVDVPEQTLARGKATPG